MANEEGTWINAEVDRDMAGWLCSTFLREKKNSVELRNKIGIEAIW